MRPAWFATLMLFWVAAVAVHAQHPVPPDPGAPRKAGASKAKEPKSLRPASGDVIKETELAEVTLNVVGHWQKTSEDALRDALEEAQAKVQEYLQSLDPSVRWKPDLAYLRKNLIKGTNEEFKEFDDANLGLMRRVHLELQVNRRNRESMLRHDQEHHQELEAKQRQYIAKYRMHGLGRVFGGFVALLAGVAGYIRLDELTKGYYTNWLRLAAASLIGAVGAGLWLLV